jgi:proteasome assembly chaperone (PAC2) family protein
MLSIERLPTLRAPVLLCACGGWSDAGTASTGALGFLMLKRPAERFAGFDPEAIYVYTTTRPSTLRTSAGRILQWPDLAFHALRLPDAPRDLVLLVGPEPDLRWKACAESAVSFALQLGVEALVTLGAFLAPVPHDQPVPLFGRTADPAYRRRLDDLRIADSDYQGPTAFLTALGDAAQRHGLAAVALWGAAPSYLPGTPNPKVSAALLDAVERLLGFELGIAELRAAGRDLEQRVSRALRDRPDLQRFVARLAGAETEPEAPGPPGPESEEPAEELPSPKAVLEDLENYLRQLQRQRDDEAE